MSVTGKLHHLHKIHSLCRSSKEMNRSTGALRLDALFLMQKIREQQGNMCMCAFVNVAGTQPQRLELLL